MAPLRGTSLTYLSDIDFDLSRILLVKSDGAVGLLICDFLLVHVSNSTCNHISISYRLGAPPPLPLAPSGQKIGMLSWWDFSAAALMDTK